MKPAPFAYLAPRSEDELLAALAQHGGDARILAGGQSLVPMMNFRVATPSVLIDINGLTSLSFLTLEDDTIAVGALARHAVLEDSEPLRLRLPLVAEAVGNLAHRAVRNRGTMGGSLALAYPNAELPLLLVTLGARLRLRSPRGDREVAASDFIVAPLSTVLGDDEFIHSASMPCPYTTAGSAFIEVARRHGDFALAAAAAVVDLGSDGRVRDVKLGVSGGQGVPSRLAAAERTLRHQKPTAALVEEVIRAAIAALDVDDEPRFPAGYRRLLLTTVAQRSLETAIERAEQRHVH